MITSSVCLMKSLFLMKIFMFHAFLICSPPSQFLVNILCWFLFGCSSESGEPFPRGIHLYPIHKGKTISSFPGRACVFCLFVFVKYLLLPSIDRDRCTAVFMIQVSPHHSRYSSRHLVVLINVNVVWVISSFNSSMPIFSVLGNLPMLQINVLVILHLTLSDISGNFK